MEKGGRYIQLYYRSVIRYATYILLLLHKDYFRMSPKRWKKNTYGWARAEVK